MLAAEWVGATAVGGGGGVCKPFREGLVAASLPARKAPWGWHYLCFCLSLNQTSYFQVCK